MLNVILYCFGKWERLLWVNNILTSKLYERKSPKLKYCSINSRSLSVILIMGRKFIIVYYMMSHTWGKKRTTLLIGSQGCFFVSTHISMVLIPKKDIFLNLILKAPSLERLNFLHLSHHQLALDLQRISGTKWNEKWNHCWDFSWTWLLTRVQWKMKEITSHKWFLKLAFRK